MALMKIFFLKLYGFVYVGLYMLYRSCSLIRVVFVLETYNGVSIYFMDSSGF